jgi:uncharacterized membrane protein
MSEARRRRGYLDWMRGLAVLVMIEAHVIDSWTRLDARHTWQFMWAMILGGFGAPLFLFLAGVSVSLSAGSKLRKTGDAGAAAGAVMRRGLVIFGLAFAFRVQAWILGLGSPTSLLKVDILNIMGPAIVAAAALWGAFRDARSRAVAFGLTTLAVALVSPLVRHTPLLDGVPDVLEGYLRPIANRSNFCLFPWAGFVFAGGVVGVLIEGVQGHAKEARLNLALFVGGAALAACAYAASWLPSPYPQSEFWGSSPAFFLLRTGILALVVGIAYAWDERPRQGWNLSGSVTAPASNASSAWSPLQQLGRSSLFVYWIHVEMVYGLISLPLHKRLSHPGAWGALALFTLFMVACAMGKDRFVSWRARRRILTPAPAFVGQ